jgi:hypothetical protein
MASDDPVHSVILRSKYSQKPQVCGYLHVMLLPFLTILDQLSSSHPMVSPFFCELLILLPRTGHEPTFHCLNDFNLPYIMTFCTRFVTTMRLFYFIFPRLSSRSFNSCVMLCYAISLRQDIKQPLDRLGAQRRTYKCNSDMRTTNESECHVTAPLNACCVM